MRRAAPMLLLLLSSCALQRAQTAETAQAQMVGMDKPTVLACMGPPANRVAEGSVDVWSYGSGGQTVGFGSAAFGNSYAFGSGMSERRYCVVNVVFAGDKVQAVRYTGPTGPLLAQGEQCAYAVQNCVHH